MQRYWAALCGYCAIQHACRGLSHLLSVIKPLNNIFSYYILYLYDVRQPITYSFLGIFSSNPLKSFQHPTASSTRGQLMRMSSLQFPPMLFPSTPCQCEKPPHPTPAFPSQIFRLCYFFYGLFAKAFHLLHPEQLHPKATELPLLHPALGFNFFFFFAALASSSVAE